VSILVEDVDDNSPQFNLQQYTATVDEEPVEGTVIRLSAGQNITITDKDLVTPQFLSHTNHTD
jgi:hypothetical protein